MKKIEIIIKDALQKYGEQYGAVCYHAGQDKKRQLPKDEFIDSSVNELLERLTHLQSPSEATIPKVKWYLTYTFVNTMEAGMKSDGIEQGKILLIANTEAEAIVEAKIKWDNYVTERNAYWEKQKSSWAHPPANAFEGISPNPRVVCKYEKYL